MKRTYIKPQLQTFALAGGPIMDEPGLHIVSGTFKQGDEHLGKEGEDLFEDEGMTITYSGIWDDTEDE